jgi:hypothetical protein
MKQSDSNRVARYRWGFIIGIGTCPSPRAEFLCVTCFPLRLNPAAVIVALIAVFITFCTRKLATVKFNAMSGYLRTALLATCDM